MLKNQICVFFLIKTCYLNIRFIDNLKLPDFSIMNIKNLT